MDSHTAKVCILETSYVKQSDDCFGQANTLQGIRNYYGIPAHYTSALEVFLLECAI